MRDSALRVDDDLIERSRQKGKKGSRAKQEPIAIRQILEGRGKVREARIAQSEYDTLRTVEREDFAPCRFYGQLPFRSVHPKNVEVDSS